MTLEEIRRVKAKYIDFLFGKPNVVACGVGYKEIGGARTDELCMVVSVAQKALRAELAPDDLVPQALEGIKTDVQETGVIRGARRCLLWAH